MKRHEHVLSAALQQMIIHSPSATASDDYILSGTKENIHQTMFREKVIERLKDQGIQFRNFAVSDDQVLEALVRELKLRGVNPVLDPILIVAEADTAYGKQLPIAFSRAVERVEREDRKKMDPWVNTRVFDSSHQLRTNLTLISYLWGLDGAEPTKNSNSDDAHAKDKKHDGQIRYEDLGLQERQEGTSTVDGLRRSVAALRANSSGTKAVIVFGTDSYDKIIILKALRGECSGAVFATTDLDARMSYGEYLKWTRNLVVASGYGLQLAPVIQGKTSPFRDVYQTATFLATRQIWGDRAGPCELPGAQPRVFEIGLRGPWDLSPSDQGNAIHSKPDREWQSSAVSKTLSAVIVVAILGGLLILSLNYRFTRSLLDRQNWKPSMSKVARYGLLIIFSGAMLICVPALAVRDSAQENGEPLTFVAGLSIWPATLIRSVVCVIAVWLLFLDHHTMSKLLAKLRTRRVTGPSRGSGAWLQGFREAALGRWSICAWPELPQPTLVMETDALQERARPSVIWGRLTRTLVLFLILCLYLLWSLGHPFTPARGETGFWLSGLILAISILLHALVLCYALDGTKLVGAFLRRIKVCSSFGDRSLQRFCEWVPPYVPLSSPLGASICAAYGGRMAGDQALKLAYAPFLTLSGLVLARSGFFDRWDWPPGLLVILTMGVGLCIHNLWRVRKNAQELRDEVLERIKTAVNSSIVNRGQRKQLKQVASEIEGWNTGVFAPWYRDSAIFWLIVPLSGTAIVDALLKRVAV